MRQMSVRDVRSALPRLDEIVEREGEVVITRHGTPILRVLPLSPRCAMPSHAELRARTARLKDPSEVLIRQDREQR